MSFAYILVRQALEPIIEKHNGVASSADIKGWFEVLRATGAMEDNEIKQALNSLATEGKLKVMK